MIGFPLALNQEHTGKVIAPAIITGSCIQLLGTSPDVTVDYAGPFLLPAGDFHGPGSYISYLNTSGSWIGTAELVDFGGNVIATATVGGSAAEIIDGPGTVFHVPFDNNVNIPSDTLCYLRFTNTASGAGVLTWYFEVVRAGALPIITTPPVVSWTVEIGNSPTLTNPVVTGSFTHITWTLLRDGIEDATINEVDKATAEAYVAQWSGDNTGVNDIGPDLSFRARAHSGAGSDVSVSNVVVFADATYLPDTAIWANPDNSLMTLTDGDTTVDQWASGWGGVSCTLAAPAPTHRAAYSTGGVNGRPILTFDGVDDFLRGTFTKGSGFTDQETGIVGQRVAFGTLGDVWFGYWVPNTAIFYLSDQDSTRFRFTSSGAANATPSATYDPDGVLAHYSGEAIQGTSTVNARVAGVVVATGSGSVSGRADGQYAIMGASQTSATGPYGTVAANIVVHAAHLGPALTADQRTHLRALLTYLTGVSC